MCKCDPLPGRGEAQRSTTPIRKWRTSGSALLEYLNTAVCHRRSLSCFVDAALAISPFNSLLRYPSPLGTYRRTVGFPHLIGGPRQCSLDCARIPFNYPLRSSIIIGHPCHMTSPFKEVTLASSDGEEESMYSTHSGQKRGLLRPYGAAGTGPIFRNLPLFGFLAGLVLFFFFFYVYQAQSAELNLVRDQAEFEKAQYSKIKADNIALKAQLEKYKSTELRLRKDLQMAQMGKDDCSTELRKANDQLQAYVPETERLRKEKIECTGNLTLIKAALAQLNETVNFLNASVAIKQNTIENQKKEIERLQAHLHGKTLAQENVVPNLMPGAVGIESVSVQQNNAVSPKNLHDFKLPGQQDAVAGPAIQTAASTAKTEVAEAQQSELVLERNNEANVLAPPPPQQQQQQLAKPINESKFGEANALATKQREITSAVVLPVKAIAKVLAVIRDLFGVIEHNSNTISNIAIPKHESSKLEDILGVKKVSNSALDKRLSGLGHVDAGKENADGKEVVGGEYNDAQSAEGQKKQQQAGEEANL